MLSASSISISRPKKSLGWSSDEVEKPHLEGNFALNGDMAEVPFKSEKICTFLCRVTSSNSMPISKASHRWAEFEVTDSGMLFYKNLASTRLQLFEEQLGRERLALDSISALADFLALPGWALVEVEPGRCGLGGAAAWPW